MKHNIYYQEEIRPILVKHLSAAKQRIYLAVGWFYDDGLLAILEKKAIEGVEITLQLIKDAGYNSSNSLYNSLKAKNAKIIGFGDAKKDYFIDHKFVVIDESAVLSGNYAWGYKHAPAESFIEIFENIPSLAKGYEIEFEFTSIADQLAKSEIKPTNSIVELLKNMEVVKTFISMGDTEYIDMHLSELKKYNKDTNVALILNKIEQKAFDDALELIKEFTRFHQSLRACIDPPIDNYRREIQLLEDEIASVSNEYSETQKQLQKFSKMHNDILGDLLLEILDQTKIKAEIEVALEKDDEAKQLEFQEAENDFNEYAESQKTFREKKLKSLTTEEQKELKKLYRQTSLKCHPDRVVEELHDQAEEYFVALNQAYKANDLDKVREINKQLKSGIMLPKSEGITELKKLKSAFKSLAQKLNDWQEKLIQLKDEATYKTIASIENWDFYFEEKRTILLKQLERLKESNQLHFENNQTVDSE